MRLTMMIEILMKETRRKMKRKMNDEDSNQDDELEL